MNRATFLIYEEARLLKKNLIDSVFEKMLEPRRAAYMDNSDEYNTKSRWKEPGRSVYITSARFKSEWFWRMFKKCVQGYYMDDKLKYNVFAADIFTAIKYGLKGEDAYWKGLKETEELEFRMEDLNEMIGESEDAFFTLQEFRNNQILKQSFRPPSLLDLYMDDSLGNKPKGENEIRIVAVDYAFANTTTSQKNDATNIQCISGHWHKGKFERHLDYIECHEASDSLGAARRVRELYWDKQNCPLL